MVGGNVINQEVENKCVHGVVMHEEDVGIVCEICNFQSSCITNGKLMPRHPIGLSISRA